MIKFDLLTLTFIWNFHNKKCIVFSLTSFGALKYDCVIKTRKMFNFLYLINKLGTIDLRFLLLCISAIIPNTVNTLRYFSGLYSSISL